ncbi:MAG: hypothetical protein LBN02_09460 [Oscillospiraceae bacterium]|jgi:hypothetical protein|nr:hypothetical protein [Oscillospiraceae bacterium]
MSNTNAENSYKSAERMRMIAFSMTEDALMDAELELRNKADQYCRAAEEYDDAGEYLDATEQAEQCRALARELYSGALTSRKKEAANLRLRNKLGVICTLLAALCLMMLPVMMYLTRLDTVSDGLKKLLWPAWFVLFGLYHVVMIRGYYVYSKSNDRDMRVFYMFRRKRNRNK